MDLKGRIAQANGRLRSANVGVTIEQCGSRLRLRATLPPKPSSKKTEPHQQRISVGIHANPAGVREAEKVAREIGAALDRDRFSWQDYSRTPVEKPLTIGEEIRRLEQAFFSDGGTVTTWKGDYRKAFGRLDMEKPLDVEYLAAVLEEIDPDSKTRRRCATAFSRLLENAGQEATLYHLAGKYSPSRVNPRDLPSDELVTKYRFSISNPAWQWVYGMMATYGLRNHEVFHLDLSRFPIIQVLEGTKTGARSVWPCYPEWAEEWELCDRKLPRLVSGRTNSQLGQKVTGYLSPKLPFKPYDLRHCWAIRTAIFSWPVELAANQMGHSLQIHNRTYQRWISDSHHQRVYELLVSRPDRPLPPQCPSPNP